LTPDAPAPPAVDAPSPPLSPRDVDAPPPGSPAPGFAKAPRSDGGVAASRARVSAGPGLRPVTSEETASSLRSPRDAAVRSAGSSVAARAASAAPRDGDCSETPCADAGGSPVGAFWRGADGSIGVASLDEAAAAPPALARGAVEPFGSVASRRTVIAIVINAAGLRPSSGNTCSGLTPAKRASAYRTISGATDAGLPWTCSAATTPSSSPSRRSSSIAVWRAVGARHHTTAAADIRLAPTAAPSHA